MKKALAYALILEIMVVFFGVAVEKTMGLSDRLHSPTVATSSSPQLAGVSLPSAQ